MPKIDTYLFPPDHLVHVFREPFGLEEPPMTEYVVLSLSDDGHWSERTREQARSDRSAIRKFLETVPGAAGAEFVAVPARSWRPVTVKVETKTALKFS